jgi:hypothetical protein
MEQPDREMQEAVERVVARVIVPVEVEVLEQQGRMEAAQLSVMVVQG